MMNRKTVLRAFCCAATAVLTLVILLIGVSAEIKPITAVDGNVLKPGTVAYQAHELFAKKVLEKTKGKLLIKTVGGGQLGGVKESTEAVILGNLQITHVHNTYLSSLYEPLMIFDLPFIFRDDEHMRKVVRGPIGQRLYKELEGKTGLKVIQAGRSEGARSFLNRTRPIRTPQDLKGLKLRAMENPLVMDTIRALGASPTPMSAEEMYLGIKQGTIDGADLPEWAYLMWNMGEVAKYFSLTRHINPPGGMAVNASWFNGLPSDIQRAIVEAANESLAWHDSEFQKEVNSSLKRMRETGTEVNEVDTSLLRTQVESVYKKYAARAGGMSLIAEIVSVK